MKVERSDAALGTEVARIVESVYRTMLDATAQVVPDTELCLEFPLTAAVQYVGAWKGALILECSSHQAMLWAERLLPVDHPISRDEAHDGLGELTNVIAGNLKPLLPGGVSLSMPAVIEGSDYRLCLLGPLDREAVTFADESGRFRVAIIRFLEKA